jgi:hypothetical protein
MIEKMEDPNTRHQWLVFFGGKSSPETMVFAIKYGANEEMDDL